MAAAADAYRRGPDGKSVPQTPKDIIVFVPAGGIPAANGKTIYSRWCNRIVEVSDGVAGQKRMAETSEPLEVFNVYCAAVPELITVPTGLTIWGTRYAIDWKDCDSESTPSDSSESISDSSASSSASDSDSIPSLSLDSVSSDDIGTCVNVPTCTWWGRLYESGYAWLAYSDLTMPECRGISPFPNIGCDCAEPDRPPAFDNEIVYTPCNTVS
jgi:hypothetical protein